MKALRSRGFEVVREGGRHTVMRGLDGVQIVIPRHRELNRFTVRGIAEDADVDWDEFRKDIA